jgi:hypothetical protein
MSRNYKIISDVLFTGTKSTGTHVLKVRTSKTILRVRLYE